jgi:hypothetical protein
VLATEEQRPPLSLQLSSGRCVRRLTDRNKRHGEQQCDGSPWSRSAAVWLRKHG